MKIRDKILIYFSTTVISLTIITSLIVYYLFSEYREEEFQQRQKEKIRYTIELIAKYKELSESLTAIMDKLTIHDFYDEKMLIFDKHKHLIYKSVDDLSIDNYEQILNQLSPSNQWIETKQGKYDLVAVYFENSNNHFYAISKAYDEFGFSKLRYLRYVLIVITSIIAIAVLLITIYLSHKISKPITDFAEQLNQYDFSKSEVEKIPIDKSSFELEYLTEKFNELIHRTNEFFLFQQHTVRHISHQLKTPIAVIVSELERISKISDPVFFHQEIENQILKIKSLADIINVLLEISKIETYTRSKMTLFRLDEMIFDIISELQIIYPSFQFNVEYYPENIHENVLQLYANDTLIRQAFMNLLTNSVLYSTDQKVFLSFDCSNHEELIIKIQNNGNIIEDDERIYLFHHFFRGKNSINKTGFGLGLVLTKKILELNHGKIIYLNPSENSNVFQINFKIRK